MEIFNRVVNGINGVYSVRISRDDLNTIEEEHLKELAKDVKLHGFRPGKVPPKIVKSMYGAAVTSQAKKTSLDRLLQFIMKQENIDKVIGYSTKVQKDDENGIECECTLVTAPVFEVKDMSGMKLEKVVYKVSDDDAREILDKARERETRWIEDPAHTTAKEGDKVVAHFEMKDKNQLKNAADALNQQDIELIMGDKDLVDEIWKHFIDSKVGDVCEFTVHYPKNMRDKKLSDKAIDYRAEVKQIFVPSKYELDDEFARHLGYENLEAAVNAVKDGEQKRYDRISRGILERNLLEEIGKQYEMELPQSMLDVEFKEIKRAMMVELERLKKKYSDKVEEGCKKLAQERVKIGFVVSKIADQNKITITKDEFARCLRSIAMMNPGSEKLVYETYSKPENSAAVVGTLLESKVLGFLVDQFEKNEQVLEKIISAKKLQDLDEEMFDFIAEAENIEAGENAKSDDASEEKVDGKSEEKNEEAVEEKPEAPKAKKTTTKSTKAKAKKEDGEEAPKKKATSKKKIEEK